jgi:dTDP-4-amino-4,6-dideoxygalactose transaminase
MTGFWSNIYEGYMIGQAQRSFEKLAPRGTFLSFALPELGEEEFDEVKDTMESGWITTGVKARLFEKEFAKAVGASHAVAVNSCTAAMHLALEAIGLRSSDEVITTPYTFAATSEVVRYFGARPVFVDVDPLTLNINTNLIESAVTPRTKAILPVHMAGLPVKMPAIHEIAAKHNLRVIEDAAHAFPAKFGAATVGSMSDFTCFSFYATKTITTGEGGMICTNNEAWAERCHIMSLHGISRNAWNRYASEGSWAYDILAPGFKYNMTDIAASIGLVQLKKAARMHARRMEIAERYNRAFDEVPELQVPANLAYCRHAWHLYMLRLNLGQLRIDRSRFVEELKKRNIGVSVHFIPLHLHPYYRDTYGYKPEDFPIAYQEYMREISLPIYSRMSDQDVDDVIGAVLEIVQQGKM